MGLFDKIRNEFVDIIEWVDSSTDTIVWKFPRYQNEIKMNSKLTVRESQWAVFLNEGTIADIFTPGMYTLSTQNMPLMTTLKGWKYGFNSPFKADVFFVSTRQFINQKWGTRNPIMLRDAEFGPVRIRAFGSFAFRVKDPGVFIKEVAATNPEFSVDAINEQLRNLAVSRGMDAIAEAKIPVLDLAANYDEVSAKITDKIKAEFNELGLELTKFLIENISLPPEVEAALDKRSSMGIVGNLGAYAQYQAANAMEQAAANPAGGLAGAGLGAGLGMAVGGQMGNIFQPNYVQGNPNQGNPGQAANQGGNAYGTPGSNTPGAQSNDGPPPLPAATTYFAAIDGKQAGPYTIEQLSQLADAGTINSQSQVWKKGMPSWASANTIPELSDIFNNMPPPIPGA